MIDFTNTEVAFQHKTDRQLKATALLFKMMSNNMLVDMGSNATLLALKMRLPIKGMIKRTIFQQFCGGATLDECRKSIYALEKYGVATVLDYGAEGKHSESSFDLTVKELTKSIHFASKQDSVPIVTGKITGLMSFDLLAKINAGQPLTQQEKNAEQRALKRLDSLCQIAHENEVALFIDGEESWIQDPIDEMTLTMMERYNKERITVYNTYQFYRHDRLAFLKESYQRAQEKGFILGAKLVRGAYMEKERERAKKMAYPSPIQPNKEATDIDYNAAVEFCVQNYERVASCVGSHNEYSTRYQLQLMEQNNIPKEHPHLTFSQLYGMSDNLTFNLAKAGYNVSKYVPYGPVGDVIPYLIRRAQENSAVNGEVSRELGLLKQEISRRRAH
ncbi:MAG: proline dehydrogenase family protein [Aureispira sp.]